MVQYQVSLLMASHDDVMMYVFIAKIFKFMEMEVVRMLHLECLIGRSFEMGLSHWTLSAQCIKLVL